MFRRLIAGPPRLALGWLAAAAALCPAVCHAQDAPARVFTRGALLDVASPAIIDTRRTPAPSGMVDESALRYYAAQKQTVRMKAEIARLKRLYPGWTEPRDLDSIQPSPPEEAPLWDLFTAGRFDELRAAMAAWRGLDPSWRPSEELARKLRRAEFRQRLNQNGTAGRPDDIVALYRAEPEAVDAGDVETLWTVADALAGAGRAPDAFNLYKSILDSSPDPSQRLATIQKALTKLPMAEAERLLALGRARPDGSSEWMPVANDITRARIVAFLHDEPAAQPSAQDLAALRDEVRRLGSVDQMSLLAWYYYKRRQFRDALDWFKAAIAAGGNAMVAHGLAHTLRELGLDREAEEVAYAWRDGFVGNTLLYVDLLERKLTPREPPYIEPARLERYARVVIATNSGEGAQGLGWYAFNSCQFEPALEWFRRATAWLPKEATVFGLALTYQRLKRQREFFETVNRYDGLFPSVVGLLVRDDSREPQPDPCAGGGPQTPGAGSQPASDPLSGGASRGRAEPKRIPSPSSIQGGAAGVAFNARKGEFPIAVPAANPLRYPSAALPKDADRPNGPFLREPSTVGMPLVARRVPGVLTMPYERLGYSLMPGWTGSDVVTALALPARGTIWREDEGSRPASATRSSAGETERFDLPAASNPTASASSPFGTQIR